MAKLDTSGLNELINNLSNFAEDFTDMKEDMLSAAGEILVDEWKDGIKRFDHVDTGDMLESVKAKRLKNEDGVEVFPQGKDKKGVRNAQKAFVLHYGWSNYKGDRFVDDIEDKAEEKATEAAEEIYSNELEKKGLI